MNFPTKIVGKPRQSVGLWLVKEEPLKHPFQITASDFKSFQVPRMVVSRGCHTQMSRTLRVRGQMPSLVWGSPNWEHTCLCGQGVCLILCPVAAVLRSFPFQLRSYQSTSAKWGTCSTQTKTDKWARKKIKNLSHCTGCLGFPWAIMAINDN